MSATAMQAAGQPPYASTASYPTSSSTPQYTTPQDVNDEGYYIGQDSGTSTSSHPPRERHYLDPSTSSSSQAYPQTEDYPHQTPAQHITTLPSASRSQSSPMDAYDGAPIPPPRTSSHHASPATSTSATRHARTHTDTTSPAMYDTSIRDRPRDDTATTAPTAARSRRKGPTSPDGPHRAASTRDRGEHTGISSQTRSEAAMLPHNAPAPLLRENSEVLNRIVVSDPRVDEVRMQERVAEAQPAPSTDYTSTLAADDEAPRQRRQDYSKSTGRRKDVQFGDYVLGQTLGEGEFGKVKLGWKRDGSTQVAIKLIRRESVATNPTRLPKIYREISILRDLAHPNIVRLHEMVETERHIGIILEYASGGELFDYILNQRHLKDPQARRLFAQLVSGVGYLHKKGIVHRDLKLENLLLDQNRNIIITDFGFANTFNPRDELTAEIEYNLTNKDFVRKFKLDRMDANGVRRGDLMQTSCGSPCYAAPELVVSDSLYTGKKVDVWSCGVILYAMLAGYLPFDDDPANPDGDNINLLYKYITSTPLTFPDYVSPHARDLLRRILVPDPRKRADLFEVARHSWLNEYHHVVAHITSSTTNIADIANSTVTSELPDDRHSPVLPRSSSVRQPSKSASPRPPHSTGPPSSEFPVEAKSAKRDRTARHTLQPEYVAPRTETTRYQEAGSQPRRQEPQAVSAIPSSQKQLPPDPPQESRLPVAQHSIAPPVRPMRDVPRSVSDNAGGITVASTSPQMPHYATRPSTQGSVSAANGQSAARADVRLPSRGSYGQPVAPTVAATTVQGKVTQPVKSSRGYNISGPISQHGATHSVGQPISPSMSPTVASPTEYKGHHKRSSTLSGLGERLFGRSASTHKKEKEKEKEREKEDGRQRVGRKYPPTAMKDPYPAEPAQQPRLSTDSKRSFSFGLRKKESTELEETDEKPRRFSLLPNSMSFKGLIGGSRDGTSESQPVSLTSSQQSSRPPTDGQRQPTSSDGTHDRRFNNFSRPPQAQHRYGASVGGDVYGGTGVYRPEASQSSHHRNESSGYAYAQYPEAQYEPRPSMSSSRPGRNVLSKPNRKFTDEYETGRGGSTGAVKKVQDFFRRRGRARADNEHR